MVTLNYHMTAMDKEINMYKIIALFGESGAGKDTIQNWLVSNFPDEAHKIVSCTTRPPRDYEVNGEDYYFIDIEFFAQKVLDGSMLEATTFNSWGYGTPIESLKEDKINIGVFNIQGIDCLLQDPRLEVNVIYVTLSDKERLIRALKRELNPNCEEICRRFLADKKDFDDIPFEWDLEWDNNYAPIKCATLETTIMQNTNYPL